MLSLSAQAETTPPGTGRIYSCVDASGRRLSSDRPIPECLAQEQRMLGKDGSPRGALPPLISREEAERQELLLKQKAQEQLALNELVRRDRSLLSRYPDIAAHELARSRALAPAQKLVESANQRLSALETESRALTSERAALGFKPVPEDLKYRTNTNEGALEVQRNIVRNHEQERERINQQFDIERARLQLLWNGLPPGSPEEPTPPAAKPNR